MNRPFSYALIDTDMSMKGTIQPDTPAGIAVPMEEYPLDLCSGKPLSVLQTGNCPENDLGDTAPMPVNVTIFDIPGSKNEVG